MKLFCVETNAIGLRACGTADEGVILFHGLFSGRKGFGFKSLIPVLITYRLTWCLFCGAMWLSRDFFLVSNKQADPAVKIIQKVVT